MTKKEDEMTQAGRPPKLTWKKIWKDFRFRYKRLAKKAVYYRPNGFAQIVVYMKDGRYFVYDYDKQMGCYADKFYPGVKWGKQDEGVDLRNRMDNFPINMAEAIRRELVEPYRTRNFDGSRTSHGD